jgi:gluconokinase
LSARSGYHGGGFMKTAPLSAYQETLGMIYFARMLDKIRQNAAGTLREDFCDNLGSGFDGRCADFLRVNYADLAARVLQGGSDEEILKWCFETGRELNEGDIFIWNNYLKKVGWKDAVIAILARRKQESGLEGRDEIETMLEYFEYDEGRKS